MSSARSPRIAYVQMALSKLVGIDGAYAGQARAAMKLGLPLEYLALNPDREGLDGGIRFIRNPVSSMASVARLERQLFKYRLMTRGHVLDGYDVLVVRYLTAIDLDPLALFRRTRAPIVTVHHAKESFEVMSAGQSIGNFVRAGLETLNSPRILSRAHGIVGVTHEIRDWELAKLKTRKPAMTVSNGVSVDKVSFTPAVRPGKDRVEIMFVASSHSPWHGTDRLLAGCEQYRGRENILLHMVGNVSKAARPISTRNVEVVWHGERRGAELDTIFRRCSVAVSSLGMHRSHLREGAVLKTRDYIARGMPFAYAYEDVDVPDDAEFAVRLPADETPIDLDRVVELARRAGEDPELPTRMRAFAERHLDWTHKVRQLYDFAASVA